MNARFLFNNRTENVSKYLSKAARWIDVIRNGNSYEDEDCIVVACMSSEEQREIVNYVYAVMEPTIKELVTYSTNVWKMYDISDDFYNQAAMEIFENFHRFNNPLYGHEGRSHAFATFVQVYMRNPARVARRHHRGYSKRLDDRRRQITRAKEFIAARDSKAYGDITMDEIEDALPEVSKAPMSRKLLQQTLELTAYMKPYDDNDTGAYYEDEITFLDPAYEAVIVGFIAELRPMERFILLQNYEYCSEKYVHLTTKELGSVSEFVELCRNDKFGKRHIHCDGCIECVDDKFIRNQRDSVRNRFKQAILETNMVASDLEGKLETLMMNEWEKFKNEI